MKFSHIFLYTWCFVPVSFIFKYICTAITPLRDTKGHFPFLKHRIIQECLIPTCTANVILTIPLRENAP